MTGYTVLAGALIFFGLFIYLTWFGFSIKVENEKIGNITISLLRKRLIFDYATDYRFAHDSIASADKFQFSNENFVAFTSFLSDKECEYTTETEEAVEELKEIAEEEFYFKEIASEYGVLIAKLESNKKDDLNKFKSEIKELITSEIVSRYYYQKGSKWLVSIFQINDIIISSKG